VNSLPVTWISEAILYHIFIDRFAGYDPEKNWEKPLFMGGNLRGIIARADYLSDLGINALWISPVFKTDAYHGYQITDFYQPEPHFGTLKDVRDLLEIFHRKNIRIMLDFVPNHCSVNHPFFQAALKDRKSKYRNWFYFNSLTGRYSTFLHYRELPKLNLNHPQTRHHIIDAAKYWLLLGFDGFRLDHAVGPSLDFWKVFSAEVKRTNREAVLIGEAWMEGISLRQLKTSGVRHKYLRWINGTHPWDIQLDYRSVFDGVLDFFFRHRITEFIAWKNIPEIHLESLQDSMNAHYARFPAGYYLPSFVDNHDMNRFMFDAGQDKEKLRKALAFQFTLPQPPILYYGTETGLSHTEAVDGRLPYADLQVRKPMPWQKMDYELIDFVKEQIIMRKKRRK